MASGAPLDDTGRRLQAVLDNASVAIFLMNDRQRCVYMNRAAELLTGYTLAEVLTLDKPLHDIVHHSYPDGRPFPLSECAIDRAFPERAQVQGEEVFIDRNGRFFPVAFTASPIQDEASETVGTVIEVQDISDRRRAEEQQRLLLNELNHRVRNTLATVQSVARQSFRNTDSEASHAFEDRLFAMARAHTILTATAWSGAALGELLRAAMAPFGPDRVQISDCDCALDAAATLGLSMVLHELGTNAAKYGALSVPDGSVAIEAQCVCAGGETRLELVWRERGGPPVTPPTRRGFGSRLIERQLGQDQRGGAAIEFAPEGVVCRMTLTVSGRRFSL